MAKIVKIGYGQVEPNHLSAQRNGQIYAQLPVAAAFLSANAQTVENGMFLKYDMVAKEMNTTGIGEDMLVYSEIKLYDNKRQGYKDFALKTDESSDGKVYPRLFKTNIGDIFTTNLASPTSTVAASIGNPFIVTNGVLTETITATAAGKQTWLAVKETTMADGQKAIKFQRVA